jgi:hypothetical protein
VSQFVGVCICLFVVLLVGWERGRGRRRAKEIFEIHLIKLLELTGAR